MIHGRLKQTAVVVLVVAATALAGSVADSPHNLSATGPGTMKAQTEEQICIFCHTPHNPTADAPLWNRDLESTVYSIYDSSTLDANPGQPTGASKLCLSCHDGTVAVGKVRSRTSDIAMAGASGGRIPPSASGYLGSDLRNDHPISFVYDSGLALQDLQLINPSSLPPAVQLDSNNELQCSTCHNPHSNDYGFFLTVDNTQSALCRLCHDMDGWSQTSHSLSLATWNGGGGDPWPESSLPTVRDNACGNCHVAHGAGYAPRLLRENFQEDTCLNCHDGSVAASDILSLTAEISAHTVHLEDSIHDPAEDPGNLSLHVECADCHNPHRSNWSPASAPFASGNLEGVSGITSTGIATSSVTYEYELCYKCHADTPGRPGSSITRQITQTNVRLEFDPGAVSFHPVETQGKNNDVPSLISPWTESSIVYCSDCHGSPTSAKAGGSGPDGPHGSPFSPMLIANFETADDTPESPQAYALCYRCHDRNSILADEGFAEHNRHIQKGPCSMCHDPHGISSSQGNSTNNTHLMNWDTTICLPNKNGLLEFIDLGVRTGACNVLCHNHQHKPSSY